MATTKTQLAQITRARRQKRIRAKISGTAECPRLAVYRSNKYVYAQLINDEAGKTIAASSSLKMKGKMMEKAAMVGKEIAEKAKTLKVAKAVFDRGGFIYTGKIKAIADAARAGGLTF